MAMGLLLLQLGPTAPLLIEFGAYTLGESWQGFRRLLIPPITLTAHFLAHIIWRKKKVEHYNYTRNVLTCC